MNDAVANKTKSVIHKSPAISVIYKDLMTPGPKRILDLGGSSGSTFDFFRALNCNIHFEWLHDFFDQDDVKNSESKELIAKLDEYMTQFKEDDKFDIILTWDMFNYMDFDCLEWFAAKLNKHCKPNTLLHSIKYLSSKIPDHPNLFSIVNESDVKVQQAPATQARKFNLSTACLLRGMPDFMMEKSFMNQPGMCSGFAEQLMRFMPDQDAQIQSMRDKEFFVPSELNSEAAKKLAGESKKSFLDRDATAPAAAPPSAQELGEQNSFAGSAFANAAGKAQDASTHKVLTHASYALENLIGQMKTSTEKLSVLDLGLDVISNQQYLRALSGKYVHDNVYKYLSNQQRYNKISYDPLRRPLTFDANDKFDVILFWDVPSFLTEKQLENVFARLHPHTHESTLIHVILYNGQQVPFEPQQFTIKDDTALEMSAQASRPLGIAPLTSSQLIKTIKYCTLSNTYIYRPGMQSGIFEYLYRANN